MCQFTLQGVINMKKTVLITGANGGVGKALLEECMKKGYKAIMIARDSEKTNEVFQYIKSKYTSNSVELITGDLSNPNDIANIINQLNEPIDVLVNNAGLLKLKKAMSVENIEMTFSVNYLAVFRLTMGMMKKGIIPKRIINITSELFKKGAIDIDDSIDPRKYNGQKAYANSKMANSAFSYELFSRYKEKLEVVAVHPGVVATDAARDYPKWIAKLLNKFLESPSSAANKIADLIQADKVDNGYYYNQNESTGAIASYIDTIKSGELYDFSQAYLLDVKVGE